MTVILTIMAATSFLPAHQRHCDSFGGSVPRAKYVSYPLTLCDFPCPEGASSINGVLCVLSVCRRCWDGDRGFIHGREDKVLARGGSE